MCTTVANSQLSVIRALRQTVEAEWVSAAAECLQQQWADAVTAAAYSAAAAAADHSVQYTTCGGKYRW